MKSTVNNYPNTTVYCSKDQLPTDIGVLFSSKLGNILMMSGNLITAHLVLIYCKAGSLYVGQSFTLDMVSYPLTRCPKSLSITLEQE